MINKKQIIRVIPVRNGVWCRLGNGKAGVLAKDKSEGIKILKELHPGEYEVINASQEEARSVNMNNGHTIVKSERITSSNEGADILDTGTPDKKDQ